MLRKSYQVKKDDRVIVISGKEKGKIGKVLKIVPKRDRIVVEKINMIKRHTRPGPNVATGGIIDKEGSLPVSNVMLICPKCTDPTRCGSRTLEDGARVRICKKCGETID